MELISEPGRAIGREIATGERAEPGRKHRGGHMSF